MVGNCTELSLVLFSKQPDNSRYMWVIDRDSIDQTLQDICTDIYLDLPIMRCVWNCLLLEIQHPLLFRHIKAIKLTRRGLLLGLVALFRRSTAHSANSAARHPEAWSLSAPISYLADQVPKSLFQYSTPLIQPQPHPRALSRRLSNFIHPSIHPSKHHSFTQLIRSHGQHDTSIHTTTTPPLECNVPLLGLPLLLLVPARRASRPQRRHPTPLHPHHLRRRAVFLAGQCATHRPRRQHRLCRKGVEH